MVARSQQLMLGKLNAAAISIYSKMTCVWDLQETSGSRVDQINAINLTASGSVSTTTGPRGGSDIAQSLAGASELDSANLGSGSAASLPNGGGSHCIFGWFNLPSFAAIQSLISRWDNNSSASMEYWLQVTPNDVVFYNGGSAYVNAAVQAPPANSWFFAVGWRQASDGLVRVCVNNGPVNVSSVASNPTAQNRITQFGGSGGVDHLTGAFTRCGWIKGDYLTPSEIAWMYNGGLGRSWAEIKSAAGH